MLFTDHGEHFGLYFKWAQELLGAFEQGREMISLTFLKDHSGCLCGQDIAGGRQEWKWGDRLRRDSLK